MASAVRSLARRSAFKTSEIVVLATTPFSKNRPTGSDFLRKIPTTFGSSSRFLSGKGGSEEKERMAINIGDMRKPYRDKADTFDLDDLVESRNPFDQFTAWFEAAKTEPKVEEANAMCVATATKSGIPSCRMVLLKSYGDPTPEDLKLDPQAKPGFVFFTNYDSRKGGELSENPAIALMFYWEPLKRSVRIEGTAQKTSSEYSEAYFRSRPHGSQIGACVGTQSQVVPDRKSLNDIETDLAEKYKDQTGQVPRPQNWGGYRIVPHSFEFWQGQSTRIHDRLRFRRAAEGEIMAVQGGSEWIIERLSP